MCYHNGFMVTIFSKIPFSFMKKNSSLTVVYHVIDETNMISNVDALSFRVIIHQFPTHFNNTKDLNCVRSSQGNHA